VTSTDWLSYPILDITEAPAAIDIVLITLMWIMGGRTRGAAPTRSQRGSGLRDGRVRVLGLSAD